MTADCFSICFSCFIMELHFHCFYSTLTVELLLFHFKASLSQTRHKHYFVWCFHLHSQRPLVRIFKLTNQGRRHHQIIWSTEKPNKAIRNTTSNTGNLTSQHKNSDAVSVVLIFFSYRTVCVSWCCPFWSQVTGLKESKNFCANYLTKFSCNLNEFCYSIETCWLGFSQCDSCFLGDHPKPNASTGGG